MCAFSGINGTMMVNSAIIFLPPQTNVLWTVGPPIKTPSRHREKICVLLTAIILPTYTTEEDKYNITTATESFPMV